jgi:hypothetical protein
MAKARQETGLNEEFVEKYQDQEKLWSGKSFMAYPDYRTLLAELPVSTVAVPTRPYRRKLAGNRDFVYGELVYVLNGYQGYLRDKAFGVQECFIKPLIHSGTYLLEFHIRFQTDEGEEQSWSCEVLRLGPARFILYVDYYRPM